MYELRIRTISSVLCKLQAKELARIASDSRVCSKQKIYSTTKVFLFIKNYGRELRMGRESGEGGKVCRKDEKGVRESKGSIKKSIKEDEAIS